MLKRLNKSYLWLVAMALLLPLGCSAQEAETKTSGVVEFTLGKEYRQVARPRQPKKDKIQVIEFFWYGCPACNQLERSIQKWEKQQSADVEFVQIPGLSAKSALWEIHARAYYTAEVLGVKDKIHQPLFDALHLKKRRLVSPAQLRQFFVDAGVKASDFDKTYNSFAVNTKIRIAKRLANQYGVAGVPNIVINGKYVTSPKEAGGGYATVFRVMDYLVEKERKRMFGDTTTSEEKAKAEAETQADVGVAVPVTGNAPAGGLIEAGVQAEVKVRADTETSAEEAAEPDAE